MNSKTTADDPGYTAVVYFHGIGTPRRHEEIARLADAMDWFAAQEVPPALAACGESMFIGSSHGSERATMWPTLV